MHDAVEDEYGGTWRDARYHAILNKGLNTEPEIMKFNDREPSMLDNVLNFLKKRKSRASSTCGYHREESKDPEVGLGLGAMVQADKGEDDIWQWVQEQDELTRSRKDGFVFTGFREAPIRFPPSFKWVDGKSAGDFTDISILAGSWICNI